MARQEKDDDLSFTEDPRLIDYNKYKERLRTALEGILVVRGYSEEEINTLLGIVKKPPTRRTTTTTNL